MSDVWMRTIIVAGPRVGKSTLARALAKEQRAPVFCGDPIELVKEPESGVTYLPSGMGWSEGSQYVADHWFTMPGSWIIEGQITARALRKWSSRAMPADKIIVLTNEPHVPTLPGQDSMRKAVMTVWGQISHHFEPIVEYR